MKADGITLSTVGAGRRREPVPRAARQAGRRPLLRGDEPGLDPRHLPQGDAAGLRPADRRGAVLPDPDLELAGPARHRQRLPEAAGLQRHDRQAGRADGAGHGARRPAPRPVAVRPRTLGRLDVGLDRALGQELGAAGRGSRSSSARWSAGRSRARRAAASRRRSSIAAGGRTCGSRARTATARGATSTRRASPWWGRTSQPATVNLNQVASGVYEAPVEHLESGAYAVRVTQTQAGKAPLGRTLGLVAPTAAEYRLLGANEPLLAAIRAATGGRELDTPGRAVGPRPRDDEPVHGALAVAARAGAAAVAAGHRAPARLAGTARARRRPPLGHRPGPRSTGGAPDAARRGPVRRARTARGRPVPARRSCARRRTARRRRRPRWRRRER